MRFGKCKDMCGKIQWKMNVHTKEMRVILAEMMRKHPGLALAEELYPGDRIPMLFVSGGKTTADAAYWGFSKHLGRRIYNARGETAKQKPMFARCLEQGRCVIPVTGYYEWDMEKNGYLFTAKEEPLLYLAGLYRYDADAKEVTILTTHARGAVGEIHHRMPVALRWQEVRPWLYEQNRALEILDGMPPDVCGRKLEGEEE